jgi:hypothetical protein
MTIGSNKKQTYGKITARTLPLYPQADQTPFADNGFQEGDSAVLTGWLKDCPALQGKKKLKVYSGGFITGMQSTIEGELDVGGRFAVKVPLENTQMVYLWVDDDPWMVNALLQPGDTCFALYDSKNSKYLFMGNNSRVQNELATARFEMEFNQVPDDENLSDEQMQTFINQCLTVYHKNDTITDILENYVATYNDSTANLWQAKHDEFEKEFGWPNMGKHGDLHKEATFESEKGTILLTLLNTYSPTVSIRYSTSTTQD